MVAVRSRTGIDSGTTTGTGGTAGTIELEACDDIRHSFLPDYDYDYEVNLTDWECGWLTVPVDPAQPAGETIELAVTRLQGADSGGRTLFFNPGGPGGSGVQTVWSLWDSLPESVLDGYDIVGWDPRGVWASKPALTCPDGTTWNDSDFFEVCESAWGPLPGYMATVNTVADLDALRVAFGQDKLDYVGYSYGTYIGALYANAHPDRVGHLVLDGSVSPDSGTDQSPRAADGDAWYAVDGYDDAVSRFEELCRVTSFCGIDDDPMGVVEEVADAAPDLTVNDVPDNPELTYDEVWDTFDAALEVPVSWAVLGVAFDRARDGDGSALAAMAISFDTADYVGSDDEYDDDYIYDYDNQRLTNITIYCSDFAEVTGRASWCRGISPNRYFGGAIDRVDTDLPIVVIGNEYDPATPFVHAREMRNELGDAVLVEWRGVGHTVFPGESDCIDSAIGDYLVDDEVPDDLLQCSFVDGIADSDIGDLADFLFELDNGWLATLVEGTLYDKGFDDSVCLADEVVSHGEDAAVDVFLEIDSNDARTALDDAHLVCD